jgi:hypothetical protein
VTGGDDLDVLQVVFEEEDNPADQAVPGGAR